MKEKNKQINIESGLYIVATPIGNLNDLSIRAIKTLQQVDIIVCENPKHSIKLLNNFDIKKKLLSLHDYNEEFLIKKIEKLGINKKIALISDAGSPLISDPGYKFVTYFINNQKYITTVPGPSSLISALQFSGLSIVNFAYYGFVPKNKKKISEFFKKIININLTSVFFISSNNLEKNYEYIFEIIGDRKICICKEITKFNESIFRGTTKSLSLDLKNRKINMRGEFTIVLDVNIAKSKESNLLSNETKKEVLKLLKKYSLTETVKIVHKLTNISKKEIYKAAIEIKNG